MTRAEPHSGPTDFASRVLDIAESIPRGKVMSYGDIAEYLGDGGPRQVGRVMALWGGGVPWWRVVHSDGRFLDGHEREALRHYKSRADPVAHRNRRQAVQAGHAHGPLDGPNGADGPGGLEPAADRI